MYGNLFLGQHEGISFSKTSTGTNLTFMGTIGDVNAALTTLSYRPLTNWNSLVSNTVISSIQTLTIAADTPTSVQIISSTISDARSSIAISTNSYFTLALNCSEFVFSSVFSKDPSLSSAPVSSPIASDAPAAVVQSQINQLIKKCYTLYQNGYTPTSEQTPSSTVVTRFPAYPSNSLNQNSYSWSVAFFSPLITTMIYPLLKVENHLLISGLI